jgi:hypothetical protein
LIYLTLLRNSRPRQAIPTIEFAGSAIYHVRSNVTIMKKLLLIGLLLGVGLFCTLRRSVAQNSNRSSAFEYAIVKWDGPDRLFYNLPDRFEMVHVAKSGTKIPNDAQEEEWCLTYAANKMAAEGWEPMTLDSRRMVFRRVK